MNRFLYLIRSTLPMALLVAVLGPVLAWAQISVQDLKVTHGPILGRPGATTMSIWMRTNIPGEITVKYGLVPLNLDQTSAPARTQLEHDNTAVVTLEGLRSDTLYYYRAGNGRSGTFRTMPAASEYMDAKYNPQGLFNFRFEYASCANQKDSNGVGPSLVTYDTLNRQERNRINFAILNGDFIYEEDRDYPVSAWREQVYIKPEATPKVVELVPSIVGTWENYKAYLNRGINLSEWHQHVASYFTLDDHELLNDIEGPGEVGFVDRRAVFRDIGVQAWMDYLGWANPMAHRAPARFGRANLTAGSDVLFDPDADFSTLKLSDHGTLHMHWGKATDGVPSQALDESPGNPNSGVYAIENVLDSHHLRIRPAARATGPATYSIGRRNYGTFEVGNCQFILLDTRSNRTLHDLSHPDNPQASILGKEQSSWLQQTIRESRADFVFIVSSVTFMIPHVGSGGGTNLNNAVPKDDAWTGFLAERETLIDFCGSRPSQQFFLLTGDLHNSFAVKVTGNVWEFASGPANSINHVPAVDEGGRPANGVFKYGPRACEIRWSTYVLPDIPRLERKYPTYCVVQVNNVFNNPVQRGGTRWVAYPHPQVIFSYHDGLTGDLLFSQSIVAGLTN